MNLIENTINTLTKFKKKYTIKLMVYLITSKDDLLMPF